MSKTNDQQTTKDTGSVLGETYEKVSDKVTTVYSTARDKAGDAVGTVGSRLDDNPLAALLGGIALGAIAGVLIPRLEKEKQLLAPLGERIGEAARAALEAGKVAGKDALSESGLTTDGLRGEVNKLVEQAIKAAGAAGGAALTAARDKSTH